jgi:hypothetical protein
MKNDAGSTRWARELDAPNAEAARSQQARNVLALSERDVRLMREQNTPVAERHLLPQRKIGWALLIAAVFGIALGELAHWVFG